MSGLPSTKRHYLPSSKLEKPALGVALVDPPSKRSAKRARPNRKAVKLAKELETSPVPGPRINVVAAVWLIALHAGAIFAPWTFTWSALALVVFLHWLTSSVGICLGFHRLLTHTGLETPRWVKNSLTFVGCMAGEGGPLTWCANHRKHHALSDQHGDPHTPNDGGWWAHMFWLAFHTDDGNRDAYLKKWVPDLLKDKGTVAMEKYFMLINIGFGTSMTALGYYLGGMSLAISWLVWVVCLRMVLVLHTTWFVNSASHMWGYRNYVTRDQSRNLWWVALIAYGEGWHNNHHAHPRLAQHGHRWWEIDMTFAVIRVLRFFGLAKNVIDLKSMEEKKDRIRAAG